MWLWWKEIIFWHIMRPSRPRLEVDVEGREEEMGVGRSAARVVSVPNYGEHCHLYSPLLS